MGRLNESRLVFRAEPAGRGSESPDRRALPWASALIVVVISTGALWVFDAHRHPAAAEGTLRIESVPTDAAVEIDGMLSGLTPLTVSLPPGTYAITVSRDDRKVTLSASVQSGVRDVHHVTLPLPQAPGTAGGRGRLQVSSDPAGAMVTVDGSARGVTPLTVADLEPGEHEVLVARAGRTERRMITVDAGATASLLVTAVETGPDTGWLATRASASLQIVEKGRLVGTTDTDRLMLPAGGHTLDFVADELGFRARRTVTITAGQTTSATVTLPQAAVNVNAVPWAEVSIDGRAAGETPIANLMVTIGTHVVTLRHPALGEKQTTVIVSLKEPARVAVDMRVR